METIESIDTFSTAGARLIDYGYPHKNNLFYASTYVKTQHDLLPDYTSNHSNINDGKYAILRFMPDGGNTNNFLPSFPYDTLKIHQVLERNMYGNVQLEANEAGLKTRYEYTDTKTQTYQLCYNNADIVIEFTIMDLVNTPTAITVGTGLPDSLTTHYRYHPDYSIDSIIDPNGKVLSYEYDMYGRLENTYLNGDKTGEIQYSQWQNDTTKSFQSRMLENYVQTTTYNDTGGNESVVARAYVDPLGRSAITATHKGSTPTELVMAGGIDYDNWDRQVRLHKPYMHAGNFSSFSYDMHLGASAAYAENQYEDTPRSRVLKSAKYGIDITDPNRTVDNTYSLMTGTQVINELGIPGSQASLLFPVPAADYRLMRTRVEDEDDKYAIEYTNAVGQKIATLRNDGTNDIVTLFHYDSQGRLVKVINPEQQSSTYTYNLLGQLYEKETVDNGITRYVYNESGQITYEQDAKGDVENYMRGYQYDEFGRNTGQAKHGGTFGVFTSFDATKSMHWRNPNTSNADDALGSSLVNFEKRFYYGDEFNATEASISPEAQAKLANLNNEKGQLTHSVSYNDVGEPIEYRFMSYNGEGYLDWEIIQFNAGGIAAPDNGPPPPPDGRELMPAPYGNTTIIDLPDYNLQGSLMTQNVDLDANDTLDLQYHYTYDEFNRLNEVYVSYTDDKEQGYKVASYTYDDALGLVEEVKYYASGNDTDLKNTEIEVITHSYDVRDRLTQLDAALFRWQMFYDDDNAANAQSPTTSWNGNINSTVADYKFADAMNISDLADFATPTTYAYTYDGINRLRVADAHGVKAGQANLGDVTYSYDKIGNLETLNRKIWDAPSNSLQTQNYSYVYEANTNRLLKVEAGVNRYTYDENGNMLSDTKKNLNNTIYGRANLPYILDMGTNTVNYMYGANDMRLYKKVDSVGTILKEEYYLRDATGRELAVIDNDYNVNWYIYGKERVASMRHQLSVGMSNLFITGNIPDGLHYAPNELRTDGTVQSADNVILQAGDCVAIMPGFSTPDDADFTAEIKNNPVPDFVYYLYDHLGNTRVTYSVEIYYDGVIDSPTIDRTVQSATDYYPYGKALRSYGRERYQSTYHERDVESGFDYRGARFYDSDVARFNSLDPLAADYPSLSDYSYVAGNPIFFVDPDGRQIYIGDHLYKYEENREWSGDESQHLKDAITALDKLYEEGSLKLDIINAEGKVTNVDILQALIDADEKIYIKGIGEGKTAYAKTLKNSDGDVAGGNVYWNSRTGIVFGGTVSQQFISILGGEMKGTNSPMSILGHELIHLYNAIDNYDAFSERLDDTSCCGTSFPDKEEQHVTNLANQFAEFSRTDYNYKSYITTSPTEITPNVEKTTTLLLSKGVPARTINHYKTIIKEKNKK